MSNTSDILAPRPWTAEPENPNRPFSAWKVTGAAKYPGNKGYVAGLLAEDDAKLIAAASHVEPSAMAALLEGLAEKVSATMCPSPECEDCVECRALVTKATQASKQLRAVLEATHEAPRSP